MKILNFGSCNIDLVYTLDHIVAPGETETGLSMNVFPGGKGLNQSIALARAGVGVAHAGCIGEDGEMLLQLMRDSGVDISYLKKVPQKNGHAVIQVGKDGENSIFIHAGTNAMITEELIDSTLSCFGEGDFLLLQNEINNVDIIVRKARQKGMKIVLNPSPYNEKIKEIDLSLISYLILNEIEAKMLTGCSETESCLDDLTEKYPDMTVVLTLGKRGSMVRTQNMEIFQSAFRVHAVDTTAAGDTFTGYFIASIVRGASYAEALKIASAASAISVTKNGAAPSIPLEKEVLERMDSLTQNDVGSAKSIPMKEKVNHYLEQNLKTASAKNLSEVLGYSAVYTQSLVKTLYGVPLSKLIQNLRCQKAAELLERSELSVSEIINEIGYENETFFRTMFKQKYGKNMLEYRIDIRRKQP